MKSLDIDDILGLFNADDLTVLIMDIVRDGYRKGYAVGRDEVGEVEPTLQDDYFLEELRAQIIELSERTTARMIGDLRQVLVEGANKRESLSQIMERVDEIFIGLEDWESERIVRTEVSNAVNGGRNAAWIDSGRVAYKMWWNPDISSIRTADDSKRFHGQIQELDKPFIDVKTGEAVMTPPNRPNCRCGMKPLQQLPKNVVVIAGQMYDGDAVKKEASIYKNWHILDIVKVWTDEAREAALEARRRKMKPKDIEELREFKKSLEGKRSKEIFDVARKTMVYNEEGLRGDVLNWYNGHDMAGLDQFVTTIFGMDSGNVRPVRHDSLYAEDISKKLGSMSSEYVKDVIKLYYCTQKYLSMISEGKDTITVYRGVNGNSWKKFKDSKVGDEVEYSCYNLSCWSFDPEAAYHFMKNQAARVTGGGGVVIKMEVPKKQVLLTWNVGHSDFDHEKEITVMGRNFKGELYDAIDDGTVGFSRREVGAKSEEEFRSKANVQKEKEAKELDEFLMEVEEDTSVIEYANYSDSNRKWEYSSDDKKLAEIASDYKQMSDEKLISAISLIKDRIKETLGKSKDDIDKEFFVMLNQWLDDGLKTGDAGRVKESMSAIRSFGFEYLFPGQSSDDVEELISWVNKKK